nr:WXG100 family type VII secretion target [Propionibacterium sp.]
MAYSHGMNYEAVKRIGRDLKNQAAEIEKVISQVDRLVRDAEANWSGKDARDFAGWWRDQHRRGLVDLKGKLEGLGQSADNNAEEQRRISG